MISRGRCRRHRREIKRPGKRFSRVLSQGAPGRPSQAQSIDAVAVRLYGFRQRCDEESGRELRSAQLPVDRFADCFLAHVAEQKVIDEYRRQHTLKHDITRERALPPSDEDAGPVQLPPTIPRPVSLPRPMRSTSGCWIGTTRPSDTIIELKQQGYSTADIADKTGWNIRKVQRFLKDLQIRWMSQEIENEVVPRLGPLVSGLDRVDRAVQLLEDEWRRHGEVHWDASGDRRVPRQSKAKLTSLSLLGH